MDKTRDEALNSLQEYIRTVQEKQSDEALVKENIENITKLFESTIKKLKAASFNRDFTGISFGMKSAEELFLLTRKTFSTVARLNKPTVSHIVENPTSIGGITLKREKEWLHFTLMDYLPHRIYSTKTAFAELVLKDLFNEIDMKNWDQNRRFWMFINQIYLPKSYEKAYDCDNVETKYFADALSGIAYKDDSPTHLSCAVTTTVGEENKTEIYIVPVESYEEFHKEIWNTVIQK